MSGVVNQHLEYGNYGQGGGNKTIGLTTQCKCGSCSFNAGSHQIFRPFIWLLLTMAVIAWFLYSFVMKRSGRKKGGCGNCGGGFSFGGIMKGG
jgi:hypothetical protein